MSGIAHDLNNVLAPIRMSLDLFREKLPDPETQRTLYALDSCVGRGVSASLTGWDEAIVHPTIKPAH